MPHPGVAASTRGNRRHRNGAAKFHNSIFFPKTVSNQFNYIVENAMASLFENGRDEKLDGRLAQQEMSPTSQSASPEPYSVSSNGQDEKLEEGPDISPITQSELIVPYTLFTKNERWGIVCLIALAGWFSTLSSFIYYPAIPMVAADLHASISMINLTVTSYLIVSAIAPAIVGDASDTFGRRPLYAVTLTLYVAANIGIALQRSSVALLILRMLQSAGISGRARLLLMIYLKTTYKSEHRDLFCCVRSHCRYLYP
jgi:hypothetical protein